MTYAAVVALAVGIAALYGQTDAKAQYELGLRYEEAKEFAQASAWYGKAAAQGNANAQYNLAVMNAKGRGMAVNPGKAAE